MKRIIAFTIAFSVGLPSAFAHGTGSQILGTVTAVTVNAITVRAEDGDIVPVTVNGATSYRSGTGPATLSDVVVGARIAIEVGGELESPTAKVVRVGAAPGGKPAAPEHDRDHTDHGTGGSPRGGGGASHSGH